MKDRVDAPGDAAEGRATLGIVGTFVLDRIVGLPGRPTPSEGLGGIAYTLAGAMAAAASEWDILPIARVGVDAHPAVTAWLDEHGLATSGLQPVALTNNRVELRYTDDARRTEHLTGGVGGWSAAELAAAARDCDALLVNFISGHELSLDAAVSFRAAFPGSIYVDLHSLFLGMGADGTRIPRALPEWEAWVSCFDVVQLNEDEMMLLGGGAEPDDTARLVLDLGPDLVACTRGSAGATCWARDDGRTRTYEIPASPVAHADPTGCGDVWAGVMWSRLLSGQEVEGAGTMANRLAAVAAGQSGVDGLTRRLRSGVT